jgi:hypothetical protein
MANATIINKFGKMKGWNSITVNLLGRDVEGITQIAYSDNVTKENVYGAGKMPIGRSQGNYEPEASFTLYKEEVDALRLALGPGRRIQDIEPFDIVVQYETPTGEIFKDIIRNAEFTNDGVEVEQGNGTITTQYTLIVSHIDWSVVI